MKTNIIKSINSIKITNYLCELLFAFVVAELMQAMLYAPFFAESSFWLALLNVLICFAIIEICSIKNPIGIPIGGTILMIFATADKYVCKFRGVELSPQDFKSLGTALGVASHYDLTPDGSIIAIWVVFIVFAILFYIIGCKCRKHKKWKNKSWILPIVLTLIVSLGIITFDGDIYGWQNEGAVYNGVSVTFLLKVKSSIVTKPSGYDVDELKAIANKYADETVEDYPNIIVIANESFADLGYDSLPNYHALTNAIKGEAYVNVFGGETSKSEWEFLTGNSMALMPSGTIPFQSTVNENTYSVVSELKSRGYYCVGMHPASGRNWNRDNVYPNLGFDKSIFIDDFSQEENIRDLVSDKEVYDKIIEEYESHNTSFIYAMTIQNHGGYDNGYVGDIQCNYADATEYLSSVHESDKAIKYLIDYLSKSDKKTVVVFFGDHLPRLNEEFYSSYDRNSMYKVPFFVWANYDIEDKNVTTSLCYLQNYMYEIAGFTPKYNALLKDIETDLPVINDDTKTSEAAKLYKKFIYNSAFDKDKVFAK